MENKKTIFFSLLLILGENNAAGNINDTLYPQQRWKRSNKVVMGLTIWNSHTGLISLVSRHSKPFFFSNNIPCYSPIGLQSLKALHKAAFLIQSALQQNAMKGYFCFGLPDLGGTGRGESRLNHTASTTVSHWLLYCGITGSNLIQSCFQRYTIKTPL